MVEKGKRLCDKRYEEIKFAVVSLYEKYDIHCTPVSGFEIATKMGAKLKPYSTFSTADQDFIRAKFPDGCSWNQNGVSYIAYNDDQKYTRQNWTISHEVGHITLKHTQASDIAEAEANFFAKFALAPPVLIHKYGLNTVGEIMERFDIGYTAAANALESYQKWYLYSGGYSTVELKICKLFGVA
jgi:hypothetical protein